MSKRINFATATTLLLLVVVAIYFKPKDKTVLVKLKAETSPLTNRQVLAQRVVESMNTNINFWGKVIDQDGNSILGAVVKMKVRQWKVSENSGMDGKSILFSTETKADGSFEYLNLRGDVMEVSQISKEGYILSPRATIALNFTRGAISIQGEPVIFKMWKKGAKEQLVSGNRVFGIIPDGRVYTLDLLEGKKIEGEAAGDYP